MFLVNFKNLLSTTIYKVLVFIGGIIIGILLVMIAYLIISLIHKRIRLKKNKTNVVNKPISDPTEVVNRYKELYLNDYSSKLFTIRINALKDISVPLIKDIASLYYPNSKDPILEVSFENLLNLTTRVVDKIENMVNDIISSSVFKIAWASYASVKNIKGFFQRLFKKETEDYLSIDVKKVKISYIIDQLDNMKNKPKKDSDKDTKEEKKYFLLDNYINDKVLSLIDEIKDEAILVYSNVGGCE